MLSAHAEAGKAKGQIKITILSYALWYFLRVCDTDATISESQCIFTVCIIYKNECVCKAGHTIVVHALVVWLGAL